MFLLSSIRFPPRKAFFLEACFTMVGLLWLCYGTVLILIDPPSTTIKTDGVKSALDSITSSSGGGGCSKHLLHYTVQFVVLLHWLFLGGGVLLTVLVSLPQAMMRLCFGAFGTKKESTAPGTGGLESIEVQP